MVLNHLTLSKGRFTDHFAKTPHVTSYNENLDKTGDGSRIPVHSISIVLIVWVVESQLSIGYGSSFK